MARTHYTNDLICHLTFPFKTTKCKNMKCLGCTYLFNLECIAECTICVNISIERLYLYYRDDN